MVMFLFFVLLVLLLSWLVLLLLVLLLDWLFLRNFWSNRLSAQLVNWQACRAFLMCCNSLSNICWFEETFKKNSRECANPKVYKVISRVQIHSGLNLSTPRTRIQSYRKVAPFTVTSVHTGESGRALGDRVSENLKAPSPIYSHSASIGHPLDSDCFNIIHKETHSYSRTIKEAMFIRVNDPVLNRNLGKYQLPHIWDSILQETPMLQLKPSSLPFLSTPSHSLLGHHPKPSPHLSKQPP